MNNQPAFKDEKPPAFDEVLKRMLEQPPAPKRKPKPKTNDMPTDKKKPA